MAGVRATCVARGESGATMPDSRRSRDSVFPSQDGHGPNWRELAQKSAECRDTQQVGLSRRICQRWLARYNEFGLAGLDDRRGAEPQSPLTPEQESLVRQRIEAGPRPDDRVCSLRGVDFQRILAGEFGVLRSLSAVYHLLHRLGYSYLRPRPRHRLADPQAQEELQAALPARLQTLSAAHPGKRLRVYFQDESRFGQQGTTTGLWARRGSRPTAVRQTAGLARFRGVSV